ncbi:MAG: DUF2061 domain-containing protein [Legionellaceae bacterium]|nr:DUF2061 domain-containing protein [Legionellaceae bacterium]MBP9774963.1 DUF2061 domain-containing protein [Legionellaceae bacterium]
MKESHTRSLMKALSWRLNGSLITMLVVYIATGKTQFALYIGSIDFGCKLVFFYLHERIWGLVPFGILKVGDKEPRSS